MEFGLVQICFLGTAFGFLDQLAHQVVAGVPPQLLQMLSQPEVESREPTLHTPVLRPGEAEIQTGRCEFAELENAPSIRVGHPQDVADDRYRQLRAVPLGDVDDTRVAGELIE